MFQMGVVTSSCCTVRLLVDPIFSKWNSKVYMSHVHAVLTLYKISVPNSVPNKLILYGSLLIEDD